MAADKTLLVVGSGPGIGASSASYLAVHKFQKVALIARNAAHLAQDRQKILDFATAHGKAVQVETWSCDVTDTVRLEGVLRDVERMGVISCVVYNAAAVVPSELFKFDEQEILYHFKTTSIGLYTTARWAMPLLRRETDNPSFLVTTGMLHDFPIPQLFSLSMVKASQRTLVLALQKAYPDIHIALLYIDGPVSVEDKKNNPNNIAEHLVKLYSQRKEDWTVGLTV